MISFKTNLDFFDSPLWGHHFKVPQDIAEQFIDGNNKRVVCNINNKRKIQAALMPSKEGWYILVNKKIRQELHIQADDEILIEIEKDTSEYGMEMPEELLVMLEQEEKAKEIFEALTPGKQRTLIYLVLKVKNTDSRIRKALAITEHLKESEGQLDFKRLNVLIKHYNNLRGDF